MAGTPELRAVRRLARCRAWTPSPGGPRARTTGNRALEVGALILSNAGTRVSVTASRLDRPPSPVGAIAATNDGTTGAVRLGRGKLYVQSTPYRSRWQRLWWSRRGSDTAAAPAPRVIH